MTYRWDRVIGSIVAGRTRAAALLGVELDDLMAAGRMSAHAAEESWDPEGGRTVASWVWLQVNYDLGKLLERAGRQLDCTDPGGDEVDASTVIAVEVDASTVIAVKRALDYLQARLPSLEWTMLWMRHAEGWQSREIAEQLGLSPNAARIKMCRLRKKSETILRLAGMVEIDG
jgi:DNA-directed RNA polymerase specialized sigma24 family protein